MLAALIRDEIAGAGPIPFDRFMDLALYHPELGYYRRGRDPFGREGDFFTAEQLQPVYGRLMARAIRQLKHEMGGPNDFVVVEPGAGRAEMAEWFREFRYVPVDLCRGSWPDSFTGVAFANEFFDALPVKLIRGGRELLVHWNGARFEFVPGPPPGGDLQRYVERFGEGEAHLRSLAWLERIAGSLSRGFLLIVDYGYTAAERIRFPHGTLMSYRSHRASEDVLADPGERDITSHVPFDVLREAGAGFGLETIYLETLARFLLRAGEEGFASAVEGGHHQLLKTLLYGLGETFRVLLMRKAW